MKKLRKSRMSQKKNKLKIIGIFPVFSLLLVSCKTYTRSNIEQYQADLEEYREKSDFHSRLYIFPDVLCGEAVKYFVSETEDLFNGSYFFYLVLNYDKEMFDSEVGRLIEINAVFEKYDYKTKPILYYPDQSAFLTIMKSGRYEYVLYNKETLQIAYVSNQLYQWEDLPLLPEHEMPSLEVPTELDDGNNSYNIYYLYEKNVGHEITD